MKNITEETEEMMKETSNEATPEKEMEVAESIAIIKKAIETTDGINSKLPRFIAVWSVLTLILYAMSYFVGSWIAYLYGAAPLIAWSTFGFTYIRKKKRLATYNVVERRILTAWTWIVFLTAGLIVFSKVESNFISFCFAFFGIVLAGLCLCMAKRSNDTSVGGYIIFIFYAMNMLMQRNFEFDTREKVFFPLFLLFVLLDSFTDGTDISYRKRGGKA
ncbi:hypothetical protein [Prevotella falsenii]|uniref:hypothetical protein n=1 Tax=Prevotella falsenii TaxID=515414 RepID=UPI001E5BC1AE|nr:hypothetical protein [Prevotella falsenii]